MNDTILCAVQEGPGRLSVTTLATEAQALSDYLRDKGINVSEVGPRKSGAFGQTRMPQWVRQFTADTNIESLAELSANWADGI